MVTYELWLQLVSVVGLLDVTALGSIFLLPLCSICTVFCIRISAPHSLLPLLLSALSLR